MSELGESSPWALLNVGRVPTVGRKYANGSCG